MGPMNKRGTLALAILSTIGIFVVGFMLLNFLMPEVTQFRTEMNCASADTIKDGTKILCLITDTVVPYYILLILSIGIGAVTSRMVF